MKMKLLLTMLTVMMALALTAASATADLLVYEPFDYPDAPLNGQGGAIGTTGTWTTYDTGFAEGMWCHPEGELTGQFDDIGGGFNMFDGTVDNLSTSGGFVGSAGPVEQGGVWGTRDPTGSMDANIGLDPSVTATFQSGTTTWFSYVGAHADNRNQGSPTFMLCTDPTVSGGRGLTMQNSGNGIGGVGGPTRSNLFDVYPHYFKDGLHHQTPGGYQNGVFGTHDGIVTSFDSTGTSDGVLDESGQPRTHTMAWQISDENGFGAANIIVGKIEWDADTNGEDIISVVRFLETEEISEAAFDALIADRPALSSVNWASNKPDLDQSQFDTINISSTKFYVDEIRIATSFNEATGQGKPGRLPFNGASLPIGEVVLTWTNEDPNALVDHVYSDVYFGTEPNAAAEGGLDFYLLPTIPASGEDVNSVTVNITEVGTYYWQVITYLNGDGVGDPNGNAIWKFTIADQPPTVEILTANKITWAGEPVALSADITDDGMSELTYLWTAETPDGVTVDFDPDDGDPAATVTATKVPYLKPYVDNDSFELPVLADEAFVNQGSVPSWRSMWGQLGVWHYHTQRGGAYNPAEEYFDYIPDGDNVGWVTVDVASDHCLYQETDVTIEAGKTYVVSAMVGNSSYYEGPNANHRIEILAADPVAETAKIAAETAILVATSASEASPGPSEWVLASVTYTAGTVADPNVGQLLGIRLIGEPYLADYEIHFDQVVLTVDGQSGEMVYDPEMSTVTLTLTVEDAENTASDSMTIDVYETACLASRIGLGLAEDFLADFDESCKTGLEDLAIIAQSWLNDIALTGPITK